MSWLGGASTRLLPVWETRSAELLSPVASSPSPGQGRAPASSSSGRAEGRGRTQVLRC